MTPPGHIRSVLEVVALRTLAEEVLDVVSEVPRPGRNVASSLPSARQLTDQLLCPQSLRVMFQLKVLLTD